MRNDEHKDKEKPEADNRILVNQRKFQDSIWEKEYHNCQDQDSMKPFCWEEMHSTENMLRVWGFIASRKAA